MRINKLVLLPVVTACALFSCGAKVSVTSENNDKGTVKYIVSGNTISMEAFPKDNYLFTGWYLKDNTDNEYRFQNASNPWIVEFKGNTTYQARFEDVSTQTFIFNYKTKEFSGDPYFTISNFYGTTITDVIIPNTHYGFPVTEIEEETFKDFTNIKSITIPSNITTIKNDAFANCTLKSITIDHKLEECYGAFTGWTKYQTIYIPKNCIFETTPIPGEEDYKYKTSWNWKLKKGSEDNQYFGKEEECGSDDVIIKAI